VPSWPAITWTLFAELLAITRLPAVSTATLDGSLSWALVAGPPSPEEP
jgi:hypothetical protein